MSDERQNVQAKLDLQSGTKGEALQTRPEATEALAAVWATESPARTDRLIEAVCERENLKEHYDECKPIKGVRGSTA
jgi:RNA-directed DNA polymerase